MKISVSVPDDLWGRACAAVGDESPSAVVQKALGRLIGPGGSRAEYAVRPELSDDLAAAITAARERLLADAKALYQDGYRQGVTLAGELNYRQLEYIVRVGSKRAARDQASVKLDEELGRTPHSPLIEPRQLIDYLGDHADYTGSGFPTPEQPTIDGIDQALADVWQAFNESHHRDPGNEADAASQ